MCFAPVRDDSDAKGEQQEANSRVGCSGVTGPSRNHCGGHDRVQSHSAPGGAETSDEGESEISGNNLVPIIEVETAQLPIPHQPSCPILEGEEEEEVAANPALQQKIAEASPSCYFVGGGPHVIRCFKVAPLSQSW